MLFKIKELKNFFLSVRKQKIKSVHIQSSNLSITINKVRQKNQRVISKSHYSQMQEGDNVVINQVRSDLASQTEQTSQDQGPYFTIVSPMIGTFYRSPAPNEAPFIKINDSVAANQTVCIIEAMKLMNEIESEVNGNIAEILVEDGDIVDCGQALMKVKQDQAKRF